MMISRKTTRRRGERGEEFEGKEKRGERVGYLKEWIQEEREKGN